MATNDPIKLRWKKLDGGKESAFLDINAKGYSRRKEYLRIYRGGTIGRKESKEAERLALAIWRKRLEEHEAQMAGSKPTAKSHRLLYAYFEELTNNKDMADNTRVTWRMALRQLRNYGKAIGVDEESFCVCDVTPEWCHGFAKWMKTKAEKTAKFHGVAPTWGGESRATMKDGERLSENSIWLYYSKLKAAMERAYKDNMIAVDVSRKMDDVKKVTKQKCYLSSDEVRMLMEAKGKRSQVGDAFLFSCMTGLRISDVRAMRWEWLTRFGNHWRIDFGQIKTKGIVYMDISDLAYSLLGEPRDSGVIYDKLPNAGCINVALRKWCRRAGIQKHVTYHTSRHTAAVNMLSGGVEIYTVSKILGHKSIKTTQVYSDIVDEKKTMAIDLLADLYGAPKANDAETSGETSGGTTEGQIMAKNG